MNWIKRFPSELESLQDWMRWMVSAFERAELVYGHGTDNPWDDAYQLTLGTLNIPFSPAPAEWVFQTKLTLEEKERLFYAVQQRVQHRIPVAYLLGRAWFAGLEWHIDESVLIPRSPIAQWIEEPADAWLQPLPRRVLDVGTGSGCIGLACAYHWGAQVDLIDVSDAALRIARHNAQRLNIIDQVNFYPSFLLNDLPAQGYDLIVSNPPYVSETAWSELPLEYHREPKLGLVGHDKDGLKLVMQLLRQAPQFLNQGGHLLLEVGDEGQASLEERFPHLTGVWLDCARGGSGILLLTRTELEALMN